MSQPRTNSPFPNLSERFSMRRYYTTERFQQSHRSQSRRLAKEKRMSGALPADPMDVDSGSTERNSSANGKHKESFLEDERLDEQFEMVNHETVGETPFYRHSNTQIEPTVAINSLQQNRSEILDVKRSPSIAGAAHDTGPLVQKEDLERLAKEQTKVEESGSADLQVQLQQLRNEYAGQMNDLRSKVTSLESSALRHASNTEGRQPGEEVGPSTNLRQTYEVKILALEKTVKEMEEQIHNLLNAQEPVMKYQTELEARYRAAVNHIEKEKRAREESELNLRSEITTIRGAYQKEKERAQKLMKTMAEMQSADPFKIDNTSITSSVKELRYDIKNWVWAQRLVPSLPAQGLISSYASRALGGKEKGPNYDFLKEVTPIFHEYTESPQEFKWVLQAYVWKRIVELVFYEDLWSGTRKSINEEETDYKLHTGYRLMKQRLTPEDESNQEYIAQFHEWRSNSARILDQRLGSDRRKRTVELIRDDILRPLVKAAEPIEQEIRNVEDLDAVIESAMRLGASMAQQRAFFTFEFISIAAYGKMEFKQQQMTDPFPPEHFDSRTHFRTVWLNLAPRLVKHGTSEGTNFDTCVQLLEGEVETRIMPKKFAARRQVN